MMEKETRISTMKIIISAALLIIAWIIDHTVQLPMWGSLILFLPAYLVSGYSVLQEAGENILHGNVFNEDFLMCIATIGALLIGFLPGASPEFAEAVFVMLFFNVGELFEQMAEGKSRKSIAGLMDLRPDSATVLRNGETTVVPPESVAVGETVIVKPGEKIPLDGVVTEGISSLNTVALTGESVPRDAHPTDCVISGCVNLSGVLKIRVTKPFSESTAQKILDLVENAGDKKAKSESFITKFARVYTPIVVISAVLLAFLPPLILGNFTAQFATWLGRALTFLVVSCPCALVISVPLTFFSGIGGASRNGILIKGASYMDMLARTETVVFDKTGTLTEGVFAVTAVHPENCDEQHLLHMAAHVERYSTHPIALSLRQAYQHEADGCDVSSITEIAGKGIGAYVNGNHVFVGNEKLMDSCHVKWMPCDHQGTIIHVAIDGEYAGHIVISDKIKEDAVEAVGALRQEGVRTTVMLTGDREEIAREVADVLHLDEYHAELLPADKVSRMETLVQSKSRNGTLVFVGDGINDAPVLARADVGIAMGALGSDAAIEAADIVLMDDKPTKIARTIALSKRTIGIARQNIIFALLVKALVLIMAALGIAPMALAVFADVGVMVLAVLNAMRALKA